MSEGHINQAARVCIGQIWDSGPNLNVNTVMDYHPVNTTGIKCPFNAQFGEEWNICIVSKYLLTKILINYKEKKVLLQGKDLADATSIKASKLVSAALVTGQSEVCVTWWDAMRTRHHYYITAWDKNLNLIMMTHQINQNWVTRFKITDLFKVIKVKERQRNCSILRANKTHNNEMQSMILDSLAIKDITGKTCKTWIRSED